MGQKVYKISVALPSFQCRECTRIMLPGIFVEYDDPTPNHIGVLLPGVGMVFKSSHDAVQSGVSFDIGPEIDLEIPPQLLLNFTQHGAKVAKYFEQLVAEFPIDLSGVPSITRDFVPAYPFSENSDGQFLKGIIP